ncbi:hypothetical protein BDY19DRAFT_407423 [Irpex rosettiformis]|uniref:Uncharacterized protein n=1 Tax=Irpex rosettiformis TaxID=378272 RepID=A0ACB8UFN7_9APHY|nr:hypothetical protein BDY19DRAFT_407423 [Irpex rosettiformis]
MNGLPLELSLLVVGFAYTAAARPSTRDSTLSTPCSGKYSPLNADNVSPGYLYNVLMEQCPVAQQGPLDPAACGCTLAAYNLRQASSYCSDEVPWSWSKWAKYYNCGNNTSPPAQPAVHLGVPLPNWATQALSTNGAFDVDAALKAASSDSKWTIVQIVAPIVVGLSVALIACFFFFWYRRRSQRKNNDSRYARSSKNKGQAWQNPKLRGQRRWFGLLPDRPKVRSQRQRESNWSIDEVPDSMREGIELQASRATPDNYHDGPHTGHSRSESSTSLLSSPSGRTNSSWISAIANLLPTGKAYQPGTMKDRDYRRVHVVHSATPSGFDLEGQPYDPPVAPPPSAYTSHSETVTRGDASASGPLPEEPQQQRQQRQASLPSFVDIRRQSTDLDSRHASRESTIPTPPTTATLHRPKHLADINSHNSSGPRSERTVGLGAGSEFSLGTSDLMTPSVTDSPSLLFATHRHSPRLVL